ncbi:unnamed protein product [Heterobilharzia americana]|nr:unnamed protein product [Heterobilharzia americana]
MVDIDERIVEEYKCRPPPNHLLNREIFWKIGCNKFIAVEPAEIYFDKNSFSSKKCSSVQLFRLKNISGRVTRLHILPPDTKHFKVTYKFPKCLAPGYSVDCRVTFLPDEPRYYEDCIRVHTEDHESQLIVPLYAYPVIGNFEFPELIEFPPTTIGQKNLLINFGRRTHVIPIKSSSVVDFEFRIQIMKIHPSFSIQPLKGVLHSGQITKLHINFQPTSYTTCELKFELHVAQVNFLAKCCTIIGNAIPGLEKDEDNLMEPVDPKYKTGEEINSIKHHEKLKKLKYSFRKLQSLTSRNFGEEREKLPEMTCPHHLVKFLLHHHEKVISSQGSNLISDELNRQQMLLAFEAMVHQNFIDEQRNQVRWQSKLGATSLSFEEHMKILETRQLAWNRYNAACTHPEVLENSTDPLSLSPSMNLISNRINQLLYEFRPYRPVDPFVKLKN